MINTKVKSARGISLVSLTITIIVLIILSNIVIYNVRDNLRLEKLENMQNDIENLRDKISSYYSQNGKIPAKIVYTNTSSIENAGVISDAVDTGDFLVIDLSALDNLTLNYGRDFEEVKDNSDNVNNYTDLYIINETSHNIFYVAGITLDDETYYTDYTADNIDTVAVDLITEITEAWSPEYDSLGIYKDKNGDIAYIPEGFKVSNKTGETLINEGLVVQGPDESEFVWIPVPDINTMATETSGTDSKGRTNYQGKLYNFSETGSTEMTNYGQGKSAYREPSLVTGSTNDTYASVSKVSGLSYDASSSYYNTILGYSDAIAFGNDMQEEYNAMIESVEKYGGFYIGRYEMSLNADGIAQSKNGVLPSNASDTDTYSWYGLYAKAKTYNSSSTISSSMIWGSQYDAMLNWILIGSNASKVAETENGNHSDSIQSTGDTTTDKINNIYDLEGNLGEWTLEAASDSGRSWRGGNYSEKHSSSYRYYGMPSNSLSKYGSRIILYIH